MSSPLAIAAVTAILKDLLNNGVIAHDISGAVGPVKVTARSPDRVPIGNGAGAEVSQLNLFLYHVTPNAALRNQALPSRDRLGNRIANPPLALDLHYMLTAYGEDDFQAEILLGYAMQLMHETPVLTRQAIRTALAPVSPVTPGALPPAYAVLAAADLADQLEMIKITPQVLSTEEVSKLWAAFQAHYRPTAAYQISVVLIERPLPTRSPLPVLHRGPPDPLTHRDSGVQVQPNLLPAYPTVERVEPPNRQLVVRMGEDLTVHGHHLDGSVVAARFMYVKSSRSFDLQAAPGATAASFKVHLPDPPLGPVPPELDPDNWQIGAYMLSAVVDQGGTHRVSNAVPLAIAPKITPGVTLTTSAGVSTFSVPVMPKVWQGQHLRLVIGDRELPGEALTTPKAGTLTFKTPSAELPSGAQWIRLRVDGVESVLIDRSVTPIAFDSSQQVTL